jgi:hypothetical protein
LELSCNRLGDAEPRGLVESGVLSQLTYLDLSHCRLGPDSVPMLLEIADELAGMSAYDLDGNSFNAGELIDLRAGD